MKYPQNNSVFNGYTLVLKKDKQHPSLVCLAPCRLLGRLAKNCLSGNNSFVRILTKSLGCSLQRVLSRKVEPCKPRLKVGEANFDIKPKPHLAIWKRALEKSSAQGWWSLFRFYLYQTSSCTMLSGEKSNKC